MFLLFSPDEHPQNLCLILFVASLRHGDIIISVALTVDIRVHNGDHLKQPFKQEQDGEALHQLESEISGKQRQEQCFCGS